MPDRLPSEWLTAFPLPLARLARHWNEADDPCPRWRTAFLLLEATVQLTTAPLVAAYLQCADVGLPRVPALEQQLLLLASPSGSQWVLLLRELARYFAARANAAEHPLGRLYEQLTRHPQPHQPLAELGRCLQQDSGLLDLLQGLAPFRRWFVQGRGRFVPPLVRELGPLLDNAVQDLLRPGRLDVLGPPGSRLVYLAARHAAPGGRLRLALRDLTGLEGRPSAPLDLPLGQAATLRPGEVAVLWPAWPVPLSLHPLVAYWQGEHDEAVLLLQRGPAGDAAQLVDPASGRSLAAAAEALMELLQRITDEPVDAERLLCLQKQARLRTPLQELPARPSAQRPDRLPVGGAAERVSANQRTRQRRIASPVWLAGCCTVLLGASVAGYYGLQRTADSPTAADQTGPAQPTTGIRLYCHALALAQLELTAGNLARAREILDSCPVPLRHWEWQYLRRRALGEVPRSLPTREAAGHVAGRPGLHTVASGAGEGPRPGSPAPAEGSPVALGMSSRLTFCRDGRRAAGVAFEQTGRHAAETVKLYDRETGQVLWSRAFPVQALIDQVAFSPEGDRLAVAVCYREDGLGSELTPPSSRLHLLDSSDGHDLVILEEREHRVGRLGFSPDGRFLATADQNRQGSAAVTVWDTRAGTRLATIPVDAPGSYTGFAFSPTHPHLALGRIDGERGDLQGAVVVWDLTRGERLARLPATAGPVRSVVYSPDGEILVASEYGRLTVWRATDRVRLLELAGHDEAVTALAFSGDGRRLFSAGADRLLRIWDVATGHCLLSVPGSPEQTQELVLTEAGSEVLAVGERLGSEGPRVHSWTAGP